MGGDVSRGTLRAFIALDLPPAVQDAIAQQQARLQARLERDGAAFSLRWTRPDSVHLTLRFLGDTTHDQRTRLSAGLQSAAAAWPELALRFGGLGCFPNSRAPRVVWLGLDGDVAKLAAIQKQVEQLTQAVGFAAEERPFAPHLTIARARREAGRTDLQRTGQAVQALAGEDAGTAPIVAFRADCVVLYRSDLDPGGARYTVLERFALGAPGVTNG
jgi:2'-5' RNA ligase